jgi:hypothetical protein
MEQLSRHDREGACPGLAGDRRDSGALRQTSHYRPAALPGICEAGTAKGGHTQGCDNQVPGLTNNLYIIQ